MADGISDIIINIKADIQDAITGLTNVKTETEQTTDTINNKFNESKGAVDGVKESVDSTKGTFSNFKSNVSNTAANAKTKIGEVGAKFKNTGKEIKESMGGASAMALTAFGEKVSGFAKECISGAAAAETAWKRFGASYDSTGGNWSEDEKKVRKWASTYSNEMGYATGDTRAASLALLNFGVSADQLEGSMKGVTALAARTGTSQEEASNTIISALNGRGQALKKATGLEIENYKTADGSIDKQRLLNDIYEQGKGSIDAHADSMEAANARIANSMGAVKTELGKALLPFMKGFSDVMLTVANLFKNLPGPVKFFIVAFLGIVGAISVVLGVVGMVAPLLTTLGTIMVTTAEEGLLAALLGSEAAGMVSAGFSTIWAAAAPLIIPLLAIIGAFAALYLIGQQLGWWSDLGDMINKIGEAFKWLGDQIMQVIGYWFGEGTEKPEILTMLEDWVNGVGQQIMDFFNNLGQQIWDALSGLGSSVASAFEGAGQWVLEGLSGIGSAVYTGFSNVGAWISDALSGIGGAVSEAFSNLGTYVVEGLSHLGDSVDGGGLQSGIMAILLPIPTLFKMFFERIGPTVAPVLQGVWDTIVNAFMGIGSAIVSTLTSIPTMIAQRFQQMVLQIRLKLQQARNTVRTLMTNIRNSIITIVTSIPARVGALFNRILTNIRSVLTRVWTTATTIWNNIKTSITDIVSNIWNSIVEWFTNIKESITEKLQEAVNNAITKAQEIYNNIVTKISEIPAKVGEELKKIPGKIKDALSSAATAALQGAQNIVSSFLSGLGINSPGIIQRTTDWEFNMIPSIINKSMPEAIRKTVSMASSMVSSWRGAISDMVAKPVVDMITSTPDNTFMGGAIGVRSYDDAGINSNLRKPLNNRLDTGLTNYNTSNKEIINKNIVIKEVKLDCANLSEAQSRKILFNALEGL